MSKIRGLLIGVSQYTAIGATSLPFCKNDILVIGDAIVKGLKAKPTDLLCCGLDENVYFNDLQVALDQLEKFTEEDDTLIVYFSGHGYTKDGNHYLVLSDKFIKTNELIKRLSDNRAKNKVLLLDCCLAGNFQVGEAAVFDIGSTVEQFVGSGYAVFASCNAEQLSYPMPGRKVSLFTYFLYQAFTNRYIIRKGKKSLNDIHKSLFLMMDTWNKNNSSIVQNPVYRASLGGTIYFNVDEYVPYSKEDFYLETEKYIIHSVEPVHCGTAKRYSVKVILKSPMTFAEIAQINTEINLLVKSLDIYDNKIQEQHYKGRKANIIFCYFAMDQSDITNSTWVCRTIWADDTQDRKHWYREKKNSQIIDDIHFIIFPYYKKMKLFNDAHTGSSDEILTKTRRIITQMITLAEQVIALFNEYLDFTLNEEALKDKISFLAPEINKLYFEESNLDLAPKELKEWSQVCSNISGIIQDFTLYYGDNAFSRRTPENRKECMNISIRRYYQELERYKELDAKL